MEFLYTSTDAAVSEAFLGFLNATGVNFTGTSTTKGLPAVDSPTPVLLAIFLYVTTVTLGLRWTRALGLKPRLQEPAYLQVLVIVHNCFCLFLSLYMFVGISYRCYQLRYALWGNAYEESETELAHYIYVFYMSKYIEFIDTIIMLLKRNVRQITVLHVYHHVSIAFIWWMIAHHAPGGDAYFSAAMNSAVHVFMYLYYLLSALLRNDEKKRRKYLFWGRYLTQLQMIQFTFNMIQAYYCMKINALYPQFLCKILFYYMISLLLLFINFYMRKYMAPHSKSHLKQN